MEPITVVVHGALGRMGREVLNAVAKDPQLKPVGAVDKHPEGSTVALPDGSGSVPYSTNLEALLSNSRPMVLVDFTVAEATMQAVHTSVKHKVNVVIGTSGLSQKDLDEIDRLSKQNGVGVVVAPNFALGAVLMIHMAKIASKFFDYAEIVEMHHEKKVDAPSGTAIATAKGMAEARGKPFTVTLTLKETIPGSRGINVEGVVLHSVRSPGLVAHQEVILGGLGQTLTIRHDIISRECFIPGVLTAIKEVMNRRGLVYGLEKLLGI
ncbi:MAG: 4-hydroxy-tetrahydrodipicolinate reductase [Chloroflexi bacterium]|nr:4-hydroxy-tetrahydrodipicolinate reductase [Chloroflexota bacterium]